VDLFVDQLLNASVSKTYHLPLR